MTLTVTARQHAECADCTYDQTTEDAWTFTVTSERGQVATWTRHGIEPDDLAGAWNHPALHMPGGPEQLTLLEMHGYYLTGPFRPGSDGWTATIAVQPKNSREFVDL